MNKYLVEKYLEHAYTCMKENEPNKSTSIRGQIATFGAAISSGSLLSAIAFFSNAPSTSEGITSNESGSDEDKENAKKVRVYLLDMIYKVIQAEEGTDDSNPDNLFDYVVREMPKNGSIVEEKVLSAAIAVKLAINLFK